MWSCSAAISDASAPRSRQHGELFASFDKTSPGRSATTPSRYRSPRLATCRRSPRVWACRYRRSSSSPTRCGSRDGTTRHVRSKQPAQGCLQPPRERNVDILYLLIPLSVVLALLIGCAFWWSVTSGQFDDLEGPAHRIIS